MIKRLLSAAVVCGLLVGCGAREDYNPLGPEVVPVNMAKHARKKRITKPPIAHRQVQMQPIS